MLMGIGELMNSVEPAILVHFVETPPPRTRMSSAVFRYVIQRPDGITACSMSDCFIHCELDGQTLRPCPAYNVALRNLSANMEHRFFISVATRNGDRNSSDYSWYIDTTRPTATISSQEAYTSAAKLDLRIKFSEPCAGLGGFKCPNSTHCDVLVTGPAYVQPSTLRVVKPDIEYGLALILSQSDIYGRVIIRMSDTFCTDDVGNYFIRTNGSLLTVHLDRRPVQGDLWTSVPSYALGIKGDTRIVRATNNEDDLDIFLDFTTPVLNSTQQIMNALHLKSAELSADQARSQGNRRFVFKLKNVSATDIVTVEVQSQSLIGVSGIRVSPVTSLTFLYDSTSPEIILSTGSPKVTKQSNIDVVAEFTKPVFGFDASAVTVQGGRITRFEELSRALYWLTIRAEPESKVSVAVPAGKVKDISGNQNLASNLIEVEHYTVPVVSLALDSFVTAGLLATSLAASLLSISSANVKALAQNAPRRPIISTPGPSVNLNGMIGHLQVLLLSDWFSDGLPVEFSETTRGLRWLLPHRQLPWREEKASTWPHLLHRSEEDVNSSFSGLLMGYPALVPPHQFPNSTDQGAGHKWLDGEFNVSVERTPFGQQLDSSEYFIYFLRGEPTSASTVIQRMESHKWWREMSMNLVWLGIGGGSLVAAHAILLLILRWRTGSAAPGLLSPPRFEIFLLIIALPSVSQSSTFAINGSASGGVIVGSLVLAIPAAFILSVSLFLAVVISSGRFVQYKEIRYTDVTRSWRAKLSALWVGGASNGRWFGSEKLPSSFFKRFGILFESRKGPPVYVFADDSSQARKWAESGPSGIGRMRAVNASDDSNEDRKVSLSKRLIGHAQSFYIILELSRRAVLGALSAARKGHDGSVESAIALAFTAIQLVSLVIIRPYIRSGVHIAESISLLSEAAIFGISASAKRSNPLDQKALGSVMLALLGLTFISHMTNEWYALINHVLRLSGPRNKSLKLGVKCAAKGLVLIFLPKRHWSSITPEPARPDTRPALTAPSRDPLSAMTATVVPTLSPGSPSPLLASDERPVRGLQLQPRSEIRKLRALAKASFSTDPREEDEPGNNNGNYPFTVQSSSTSSDDPRPSSPNVIKHN
uniref:Bacterial Ig-like domain-containing protein n=1 Tax=Kalanchoe fedtschenkoi TaxID=63787 RepID=A0A7N1A4A1_KALFE